MRKGLVISAFSFIISISGFAQSKPEIFLDKGFYGLQVLVNNPIGSFRKEFKSDYVNTNDLGASVHYFFNPKFKSTTLSRVFLGGELGFTTKKQTEFSKFPTQGTFYMKHNQTWLNAVLRFRPTYTDKTFTPFFDAFAGPKFYTSRMLELYDQNQVDTIESYPTRSLSYGLTAGCGYKLEGRGKKARYLEFSVTYAQSNPLKLVNTNINGITDQYTSFAAQRAYQPQSLMFKLGFSNFM
ncbi:hypothetical protein [Lacihabitans lacunae]|uniref:Outer membrane protein beta-barrel domain-containing protein n=1 Tax=Lacihabitans lacunae TaxID=1028214 RepID=A0ABV7YUK4_9BACT